MDQSLLRRIGGSVPAILGGLALLAGLWLNGEIVAVEVIRALVGSIGIVPAVPLTTFVAALLIVPARAGSDVAA